MQMWSEHEYRLRWMDFDRYGRMQPAAVLDLFQDMATIQANDMGIGRDDMMEEGVFWAVIRQKFEVVKDPEWNSVVTVRSWPHTPTRFSFLRDYSMRDDQGELLVKATSEWVLMNFETRKFESVKDHYHGPTDFYEERMFERKCRKIADFEADEADAYTVVPTYSDIDINGHVNNAMYANYVVNALDPGEEGRIKSLQIDYRYEVLPGVPLKIYSTSEDDQILFKAVNPEGDIAFAAALKTQ